MLGETFCSNTGLTTARPNRTALLATVRVPSCAVVFTLEHLNTVNRKRCFWSHKRGKSLLPFTFVVHRVNIKTHETVQDQITAFVLPIYKSELANFFAYEKRFERLRLYLIGLAMILLLIGQLAGTNSRTVYFVGIILGLTLIAFPFSHHKVYDLLGVRNAILLLRLVGGGILVFMLYHLFANAV